MEVSRAAQKAVALAQQEKNAWTRADVIKYLGRVLLRTGMDPAAAAALLEEVADRVPASEFEPVACLEAPEPAEVPAAEPDHPLPRTLITVTSVRPFCPGLGRQRTRSCSRPSRKSGLPRTYSNVPQTAMPTGKPPIDATRAPPCGRLVAEPSHRPAQRPLLS